MPTQTGDSEEDNSTSNYVKILAYDEEGNGEGIWARPLGNSLYEVQSIVMFAPGLHPEDIVRCIEEEGKRPVVQERVHRGPIRTIMVVFSERATEDQVIDVLWELARLGAPFEKASDKVVALGVQAHVDFDEVLQVLERAGEQIVEAYEELD